jgi:hypothetical protein
MAADQLSALLERLLPYVQRDEIAITGGVGIEIGLAALGHPSVRDGVADLDLVATSLDAVGAGVTSHFLVSHYHVEQPGIPKFMLQIVDPESRIRIDIFPDLAGAIADAQLALVGSHRVQVLPLTRIFAHKRQTLERASPSRPIDPKHVADARLLAALLGNTVPEVVAEAIAPNVYGTESDRSCSRCELSRHPEWPLASKDRIFDLLGWTRKEHPLGA